MIDGVDETEGGGEAEGKTLVEVSAKEKRQGSNVREAVGDGVDEVVASLRRVGWRMWKRRRVRLVSEKRGRATGAVET